ncbi:hypothetical protein ACJA3G_37100, partial [Streptomyces sp. YS-3]
MGSGRRRTAYGQVLLCAALLLGIFTMHTVGHPAEHSSPVTAVEQHSEVSSSMGSTASPMSGGATAGEQPVAAHH